MPITYRIHPAIGVARVGDSRDEFFIGPEAPGVPPAFSHGDEPGGASGHYKDHLGKIKRQGARFRVFEYTMNDAGTTTGVREVTAAEATIEWEVHLANRKAASLGFPDGARRNKEVADTDVETLVIDAGAQKITGSSQAMHRLQGRFKGIDVPLGDLCTDEAGRLIVLGGFGTSTPVPADRPLKTFANNDGWCDDVSDGPVRAAIRLKDSDAPIEADPAWLLVAPPDFAPSITSVVTLYDVVYAMMARLADPTLAVTDTTAVSFTRDIYPILSRVSHMRWVSADAARPEAHGEGSFGDFIASVQALASNDPAHQQLRGMIFGHLRNPAGGGGDMPKLPESANPDVKGQSLTDVQYRRMERWAAGRFDADWTGAEASALPLDELPDSERPKALDRAALEACVGGPFFPGIEAGVIMLDEATYDKNRPFRINDTHLTPGSLTARMAVPWQADFHDCTYEKDEEHPSQSGDWWPGQRPIHVLRDGRRTAWMPTRWDALKLVHHWSELGFVVEQRAGEQTTFVEAERSAAATTT